MRVSGSIAFRAAMRATLVFGLDPEEDSGARGPHRVLAPGKGNYSPPGTAAHRVRISGASVPDANGLLIPSSEAVLGEECGLTASDVLGAVKEHEKARSKQDFTEDWLRSTLPRDVRTLKRLAEEQGISWRTMERAKAALGVKTVKLDYKGGWRWELP